MSRGAPKSLSSTLVAWITLPVILAGSLIAVLAFAISWQEIEEVFDAQMVVTAKELLTLAEHEITEVGDDAISLDDDSHELFHKYEMKTGYRIWYRDVLAMKSANAAGLGGFEAPPGFSTQERDGKRWRFFVMVVPDKKLRIEVSQLFAIRYELIRGLVTSLIAPSILFVPIIVLIVWFGVQRSLSVLVDLSQSVDRRHSTDLTPVPDDEAPIEALPLVRAINRLFARLADAFRREREFTDDIAHELRTPLAAMRTQTQVLMMKPETPLELAEGLGNLYAANLRATSLVEQMLSLARLQHDAPALAQVNLAACTREAIAALAVSAGKKHLKLTAEIPERLPIQGHADSLKMMVRNLLDNAIKYAPEGSTIAVTLTQGRLVIADNGPGIPAADRARVFERFVRADRSGQGGSGLGLAIVRRVADIHGATVTLDENRPQGLIATVAWPAA